MEIKQGDTVIASGMWTKSGFLLVAGSLVKVVDIFSKAEAGISKLKKQMIDKELLVVKNQPDQYELQADVYVSAPNIAAGLVLGLASDGLFFWHNKDGVKLGDLVKKIL